MSSFHITGFDHLVLRCADVDSTSAWDVDTLGLAIGEPGVRFGAQGEGWVGVRR
jgi:hypothetical protein